LPEDLVKQHENDLELKKHMAFITVNATGINGKLINIHITNDLVKPFPLNEVNRILI
jgi:hypothetical protein